MADFEKNNDEMWVFLSYSNKDFDKVRILRNNHVSGVARANSIG